MTFSRLEDAIRSYLRRRVLFARVLQSTLWQVADKVLRGLVVLLVDLWVARYLAPGSFGTLNFAIALVALFSFLSEAGVQSILVRDLVRLPEKRSQLVSSGLTLRLIGGAIGALFATLAATVLVRNDRVSVLAVCLVATSLIPQAWTVIDNDFQARLNPKPMVITRSLGVLLVAGFKVLLICIGAGLPWFALASFIEALFCAALMVRFAGRDGLRVSLSLATSSNMKAILNASWPLAISSLSVFLYMRIDQVMLGKMRGAEAVGVFSAAVRISESWYFLPMAAIAAIAPALTRSFLSNPEHYDRKSLHTLRAIFWSSTAAASIIALGSAQLVSTLFGPNYSPAAEVLALHAWSGIFAMMGVASGPWFVNAGFLRLRMLYTLAGAAANLLMNLVMIPAYGPKGAAISTLCSYAIAGFLMNASTKHTRPIFALQLRAICPI